MQLHRFYIDALDRVLALDIPDELCADALSAEAGHLAGLDSEQFGADDLD